MSIQGDADGGQLKALFEIYNARVGSQVVDLNLNYNTGDKYSERIATGSQIKDAFAAINANESSKILRTDQDYNATNGIQLKEQAVRLAALAVLTNGPVWGDLPQQNAAQGGSWMVDLNDYCVGVTISSFVINTGALPTGITLDGAAAGTFSGTVTNVGGAGSVTFDAVDANGTTQSGTMNWTISG